MDSQAIDIISQSPLQRVWSHDCVGSREHELERYIQLLGHLLVIYILKKIANP